MSKKIETAIKAAEKKVVAESDAKRAEAEALTADLRREKANLADLEAAPGVLLAKARTGEDVAPGALSDARTAIEVATARIEGLEVRLRQTQRGIAASDASAADLLVPVFQMILIGVPAVTTVLPSEEVVKAAGTETGPLLVLSQVSETERTPTGLVKCEKIEVTFIRPSWASGVERSALEAAADKAGLNVNVKRADSGGTAQTFTLNLIGGTEIVPVIERLDDSAPKRVAQIAGREIVNNMGVQAQHPSHNNDGSLTYRTPFYTVTLAAPEVSEEVDNEGIRTIRVTINTLATGQGHGALSLAMTKAFIAGGVILGLGRLNDVAFTNRVNDAKGTTNMSHIGVDLEYVSRVSA